DVDKIRTNKRKVAGLPGEELVTRLTADMGPELYFGWKYLGKEDSGEHPEIEITIDESPDNNLDEKMKIWDRALDSFRPAYKR
ncbi:MAG: T6SS immunity protein Tli4 family protein, partial [Smithellaceae bacterium]